MYSTFRFRVGSTNCERLSISWLPLLGPYRQLSRTMVRMDLSRSQRLRRSSIGTFDHTHEPAVIIEMNANRLRDKLSRITPPQWMTQDELYEKSKHPDLWPWQRTEPMTPTPPETPEMSSRAMSLDPSPTQTPSPLPSSNEPQNPQEVSCIPLVSYDDTHLRSSTGSSNSMPKAQMQSRDMTTCREGRTRMLKAGHTQKRTHGVRKSYRQASKHGMLTRSRCRGKSCLS